MSPLAINRKLQIANRECLLIRRFPMTAWKKPFAVIAITGGMALAWFVGADVFRGAQYARAADEIEAARQQLASVQDLAAVYKTVGKVVEPSVVKIEVHKTVREVDAGQREEDFLKQFFPDRDGD